MTQHSCHTNPKRKQGWPSLALRVGILGILLLTPIVLGCRQAPASPEESHPAQVKAIGLKRATLEQWTAPLAGTIQPLLNHVAVISGRVDGAVLAVLPDFKGQRVREGQDVEKGQVIVQLDDSILRANRDKLVAQKKQAEIAVNLARNEVERLQKLDPLVSPTDLLKARGSLQDVEAKDKAAAFELDATERQLSFYALRSPIAGRLGMVQAMPGQWLAAGTAAASVVDLKEIDVICWVPPDVALRLAPDHPARLLRNSDPPFGGGKLAFIDHQGQAATGMFGAKVRFANEKLGARANDFARVQVRIETRKDVLSLPAAALSFDQEPPGVLLVTQEKGEDGKPQLKARKLEAIIGIRDRDQDLIEIRELEDPEKHEKMPVREDMQFIVGGGTGLETGDLLELKKEEEKEKEK